MLRRAAIGGLLFATALVPRPVIVPASATANDDTRAGWCVRPRGPLCHRGDRRAPQSPRQGNGGTQWSSKALAPDTGGSIASLNLNELRCPSVRDRYASGDQWLSNGANRTAFLVARSVATRQVAS